MDARTAAASQVCSGARTAALLAGLLKAPSRYSPVSESERAAARATVVLDEMEESGVITPEQRAAAVLEPVRVSRTLATQHAQYFVDWLDKEIRGLVGEPTGPGGPTVTARADDRSQFDRKRAVEMGELSVWPDTRICPLVALRMLAIRVRVGPNPSANWALPAINDVAPGKRIMMRSPSSIRTMRDSESSRSSDLLNCQRKLRFAFRRRSNWTISAVGLLGARACDWP